MSERYAACRLCKGTGYRIDPILLNKKPCGICESTGMSGDAIDKIEKDLRDDYEREIWDLNRNEGI